MSDSTPDSSATPSADERHAAAIQSAKPLAPRPRPAFTRKKKSKTVATASQVDLSDIPEAVPLEAIPEGIPLPDSDDGENKGSAQKAMARPAVRTPGNRPIRPKHSPRNRVSSGIVDRVEAPRQRALRQAPALRLPTRTQRLHRARFVSRELVAAVEVDLAQLLESAKRNGHRRR